MKFIDLKLFDPNKSFFSLPIVWAVFSLNLTLIVGCVVYIVATSQLEYLPGYEGINTAIKIFSLPIAILATLVPLVAVLATNHRSIQSSASMDLARAQNNFSNYYKHLEEFIKYVKDIPNTVISDKENIGKVNVDGRRAHRILFPDARTKGLQFSAEAERLFSGVLITVADIFTNQLIFWGDSCLKELSKFAKCLDMMDLGLKKIIKIEYGEDANLIKYNFDDVIYGIPKSDLRIYLSHGVKILNFYHAIFLFDENYDKSGVISTLLQKIDALSNEFPIFDLSDRYGDSIVSYRKSAEEPVSAARRAQAELAAQQALSDIE